MNTYFSSKSGLWHYLSMAEGNYGDFLRSDTVKLKKYFYVLRPVLACRWILERGSPPPMLFRELMEAQLESSLIPAVTDLLRLKVKSPEVKLIPRVTVINDYLDRSIAEVKASVVKLPREQDPDWAELDRLFLSVFE